MSQQAGASFDAQHPNHSPPETDDQEYAFGDAVDDAEVDNLDAADPVDAAGLSEPADLAAQRSQDELAFDAEGLEADERYDEYADLPDQYDHDTDPNADHGHGLEGEDAVHVSEDVDPDDRKPHHETDEEAALEETGADVAVEYSELAAPQAEEASGDNTDYLESHAVGELVETEDYDNEREPNDDAATYAHQHVVQDAPEYLTGDRTSHVEPTAPDLHAVAGESGDYETYDADHDHMEDDQAVAIHDREHRIGGEGDDAAGASQVGTGDGAGDSAEEASHNANDADEATAAASHRADGAEDIENIEEPYEVGYANLAVIMELRGRRYCLFDNTGLADDDGAESGPIAEADVYCTGEEWGDAFEKPLTNFISDLKQEFELSRDVVADLPQLKLSIPEGSAYGQSLCLNKLYDYLWAYRTATHDGSEAPLILRLTELDGCLETQLQYYQSLVHADDELGGDGVEEYGEDEHGHEADAFETTEPLEPHDPESSFYDNEEAEPHDYISDNTTGYFEAAGDGGHGEEGYDPYLLPHEDEDRGVDTHTQASDDVKRKLQSEDPAVAESAKRIRH
ncbi:uncharacterized protein BJ171DRAFT_515119 [Polychytrium aggregatum]|uniref:uncharacterized protein n=1 Tax=Polychytrium aggregatum TaxID=110093 RepID=UPI0022FDE8A0|nr:uncharacterized protein BJ171DRAFT_515119 [Polychytrium aggregatum]KAI9202173.1 hypothetical protein BJ171DRAFT_515119 [Polychytrium aggregatum]